MMNNGTSRNDTA